MSLKDAEKINGKIYRTFKMNGQWSDPLRKYQLYSRTLMPEGTEYKEANNKATMLSILRTDKVPLKEENLSEATIVELDKANIIYEKTIDDIIIKPLPKL